MYSNKLICDILIFVNNNLNQKISIKDLEENFFYNRYYIMKLFKQEIKLTIFEYINSLRIYNSILQIKSQNSDLIYIALKNGFYSLEYFSETFKKITGINPNKFKTFFRNNIALSSNDVNQINKSIIKLYEISKIKDNYLSKQKPNKYPTKKLSIFH